MPDLEELIRRRQAQLRGRPLDWTDRFIIWYHRRDWVGIVIGAMGTLGAVLAFFLIK